MIIKTTITTKQQLLQQQQSQQSVCVSLIYNITVSVIKQTKAKTKTI